MKTVKNVENVETGSGLEITFLKGQKQIKSMLNFDSELMEHGEETRSVLGMCGRGIR